MLTVLLTLFPCAPAWILGGTEEQLRSMMEQYGETLDPANNARWWEAAVAELDSAEAAGLLMEAGAEEEDEEEEEAEEEEGEGEGEGAAVAMCVADCRYAGQC